MKEPEKCPNCGSRRARFAPTAIRDYECRTCGFNWKESQTFPNELAGAL
jgi:rubredoxin